MLHTLVASIPKVATTIGRQATITAMGAAGVRQAHPLDHPAPMAPTGPAEAVPTAAHFEIARKPAPPALRPCGVDSGDTEGTWIETVMGLGAND